MKAKEKKVTKTSASLSGAVQYPDEPLFIIGAPRSGTTVLGRILLLLEDDYFQPATEGHFLYWFLKSTRDILENPGKFGSVTHSSAVGAVRNHPVLRETIAESVHNIYRRIGGETGQRNWIDKTPDLQQVNFLPFLLDLFPNAKVILIHRHPLEVFISATRNWEIDDEGRKRDVLERWTQLHQAYRGKVVPRLAEDKRFIVRQENLIRRRDETVGGLLDFLQMPDRDEHLARIRQFLVNNEVNRTKAFAGGGFDLKSRASESDIEMTREICGQEMQAWNYEI